MAEEEFGLSSDGPITVPCDAILMEYVITLIRRGVTKDLEKTLLKFIDTNNSALFSSVHQGMIATQPTLVCGQ
ncbi:hypothetical protein FNV43_RR21897 [Rhamnella rubrinervis]|uniref:Uncharacterized protein n=1 Tax=Rhamnella rubrinervis TaxID=2594499 RepID=A0A8K0DQI5_9ROSA|nr:hypothetical protein FNV43_RR21897 [Rhamnella rubrinervis]